MNNRLLDIVDRIFEPINYSEKSDSAKEKIYAEFEKIYDERHSELGDMQTEGMIMQDYGTFETAAALAGISENDINDILSSDGIFTEKTIKKAFRRILIPVYFFSVFAVFFIVAVVNAVIYHKLFNVAVVFIFAVLSVLPLFLFMKRRKQLAYNVLKLDNKAYSYLKKLSDRYTKRFINCMFITVGLLFTLLLVTLTQFIKQGYSVQEIESSIWNSIAYIEFILMILVKNIICLKTVCECFSKKSLKLKSKTVLMLLTSSLIYWIIVSVVITIISANIQFVNNYIYGFFILYLVLCLIYDLTFRKNITFKNILLNVKRAAAVFVCCTIVLVYNIMQMDTWYLEPYISSVSTVQRQADEITYNEKTGVYTITTDKEDFRILQLTDIHLGGSMFSVIKDYKALNACYDLIEYTNPDLVVVTGDMVFPLGIMSLSLNNSSPIMQFASFMRNTGIPWAFTYGNHDTEDIANQSVEEIDTLYKSLSFKTSNTLLYPYVQPDITGRSNQYIELRNSDGSLNQALFLIDSNDYTDSGINDYDYIHDDQVEWYKEQVQSLCEKEGKTISSMIFFHIPLQQYRTAYELYEDGSEKVKYFFGKNGEAMINKVCCSEYPSKLFDTAKELGSTKAMFCGHDHYNNMSLEYEGIRLTYGMSIDYLAMPGIENDTEQRGGTLITCHPDSSFDIEQIPLDKIS